MQLALAMLVGVIAGVGVFLGTRKRPVAAVWIALVLGVAGSVLFVASINGWFIPELGRLGAIGVGLLSGIATALAAGSLFRGERRSLNWVALLVAVPPLLFLVVFGIAELVDSAS